MAPDSARLKAVALAFAIGLGGVAMGSHAQGVVNMPKLSAALANQIVGDSVAICAQKA